MNLLQETMKRMKAMMPVTDQDRMRRAPMPERTRWTGRNQRLLGDLVARVSADAEESGAAPLVRHASPALGLLSEQTGNERAKVPVRCGLSSGDHPTTRGSTCRGPRCRVIRAAGGPFPECAWGEKDEDPEERWRDLFLQRIQEIRSPLFVEVVVDLLDDGQHFRL